MDLPIYHRNLDMSQQSENYQFPIAIGTDVEEQKFRFLYKSDTIQ